MPNTTFIEAIPQGSQFTGRSGATVAPNNGRIHAAIILFVVSSILLLSYVYLRPAQYQSIATLYLAPNVDSSDSSRHNHAQYALIQRHILTSTELINDLHEKLRASKLFADIPKTSLALQTMLSINHSTETNIVQLQVSGPHNAVLPYIIHTWIEVYRDTISATQTSSTVAQISTLQTQLQDLEEKITGKRHRLDQFRNQNDILSIERDQNHVQIQLNGLTESLNKANDAKVAATARLTMIQNAMAEGKLVIEEHSALALQGLEQRANELREQLSAFEQQFTPEYMALDPNVKAVNKQLKLIEEKLTIKRDASKKAMLFNAEQALSTASQSVNNLKQQLANFKKTATTFTARFDEHTTLLEELDQLEILHRNLTENRVQLELALQYNAVQTDILQRPTVPQDPISPKYLRDTSISLGIAFLLSIMYPLLHIIFTSLRAKTSMVARSSYLYDVSTPASAALPPAQGNPVSALPIIGPAHPAADRELTEAEINSLLDAANKKTRLLICNLLNGLSLDEAVHIRWGHVKVEEGKIFLSGGNARTLLLPIFVTEIFQQMKEHRKDDAAIWQDESGKPMNAEDLSAQITCTAYDAGLPYPAEVSAQTLEFTYRAYLVRQGVQLRHLEQIVGYLSPSELLRYGRFSPPVPARDLTQVNFTYTCFNKTA